MIFPQASPPLPLLSELARAGSHAARSGDRDFTVDGVPIERARTVSARGALAGERRLQLLQHVRAPAAADRQGGGRPAYHHASRLQAPPRRISSEFDGTAQDGRRGALARCSTNADRLGREVPGGARRQPIARRRDGSRARAGHDAYLESGAATASGSYRVRVGHYANVEDANRVGADAGEDARLADAGDCRVACREGSVPGAGAGNVLSF